MKNKYQEALDRTKEIYEVICDELKSRELKNKMNEDVEALQELVDKATPKKPVRACCEPEEEEEEEEEEWDKEEELYDCPNCGEPLPYNFDYDYPIKNKCCLECQQVLNWGEFDV